MQNPKTFFLFIDRVDYSFTQTEIVQISKKFKKVVLVDFFKTEIALPSNVLEITLDYSEFKSGEILFRNIFLVIRLICSDILFRSLNFNYTRNLRNHMSYLLNSIYLSEKINAIIKTHNTDVNQSVFSCFWFNSWSIALGILKRRKIIPSFYSRAHGIDLFEYRSAHGRIPFREFQLSMVNKVFSVSQNGEAYLKESYPHHALKIGCNYLGSANGGENIFNRNEIFTLVSCANTRNIKRIYLIPEILKKCTFPIRWIHIGDENLSSNDPTNPIHIKNKEDLKNFPNIYFEFRGKMENEQIFDFYKKTQVNLFISVSETEGLPVSIMEAISFGIPVMATDVGGCREIVNAQTGILIPKEFDLKATAKLISEFKDSDKNTPEFRKQVRHFWSENFEVNSNYEKYFQAIEN